jgi:hypothetical protein
MSVFTEAANHAIRQGLRTDLKGKHRHYKAASFRGRVSRAYSSPHREGHHFIELDRLWTWRKEEISLAAAQTISVPSGIAADLALCRGDVISFEAQVRFNTGHGLAAEYSISYEKDHTTYPLGLHYAMRLHKVFPPRPTRSPG